MSGDAGANPVRLSPALPGAQAREAPSTQPLQPSSPVWSRFARQTSRLRLCLRHRTGFLNLTPTASVFPRRAGGRYPAHACGHSSAPASWKGRPSMGSVCAVDSWHFRIAQIGNALDAKNTGARAPISTAETWLFSGAGCLRRPENQCLNGRPSFARLVLGAMPT